LTREGAANTVVAARLVRAARPRVQPQRQGKPEQRVDGADDSPGREQRAGTGPSQCTAHCGRQQRRDRDARDHEQHARPPLAEHEAARARARGDGEREHAAFALRGNDAVTQTDCKQRQQPDDHEGGVEVAGREPQRAIEFGAREELMRAARRELVAPGQQVPLADREQRERRLRQRDRLREHAEADRTGIPRGGYAAAGLGRERFDERGRLGREFDRSRILRGEQRTTVERRHDEQQQQAAERPRRHAFAAQQAHLLGEAAPCLVHVARTLRCRAVTVAAIASARVHSANTVNGAAQRAQACSNGSPS
jgi:hypothetical protein